MAKRTPAPKRNPGPKSGEAAATWERVDSLVPWPRNPRTKHDIQGIAESIKALGFAAPLVCRTGGSRMIVLGHGRWEAAPRAGLHLVPVRWMDLSDDQATKLALADNRLSQRGEDDQAALRELLQEVGGAPGFEDDEWLDDSSDDLESLLVEPSHEPLVDEFWVVIRGPLPLQPEVVAAVEKTASGCQFSHGSIFKQHG